MPQKRKYFKSTEQQFAFSTVPSLPYLYIYKHHCPQIIVRFPEPQKTITGYDVTKVEIVYWPFYQDVLQGMGEGKVMQGERVGGSEGAHIEKIEFPYKGQLILNKESDIFVEFLKRQLQSLIQQSANPLPQNRNRLQYTYKNPPPVKISISQVFQILLTQWFNNSFINAIFLSTQKHLATFTSFDHGFLKLQILKTSLTNIELPFYKSPTAKLRQIKQYVNKHYYFQFESSVLYQQKDFQDVEKVGVVMPRPISMNEFFYEVLIQMFHEFQEEFEKSKEKEKKKEERMRIKETLLQNFRSMGLQPNFPDIKVDQDQNNFPSLPQVDSLDTMLNQIFAKKKKPKQDQTKKQATSTSQIQTSTLKPRRQSVIQNSPQKKQQNHESAEDDQGKRKSNPRKNIKIQPNIKVIRSFTSEIIDDDFQPKPQRRFVTRGQFDKLIKLSEKINAKRQEKRLKALHDGENKGLEGREHLEEQEIRKENKQQQVVFVGVKNSKQSVNTSPQKSSNPHPNFVFDYFSTHHDTLILQKTQPHNPYADLSNSLNPFDISSREQQLDPVVIPGLQEISIIEKRGRERNSKIKAIELMYEGGEASMEQGNLAGNEGNYENDNGFDIDDSDYD